METIQTQTDKSFDCLYKVLEHNHLINPWTPENKPIVLRGFQQTVVNQLPELLNKQQLVGAEIYCAGGKTILTATAALPYLKDGKRVVFISPKRDAMVHFVKEFKRVLTQHMGILPESYIYARYNTSMELFPPNAMVYIVTPYDVVKGASDVVISGALGQAGLVIIDEVHRIPHDPENETAIIGKVEKIIRKKAMTQGAHVLAVTGTYGRADGKAPFGQHTPDIKVTAQQLILEGSLSSLYGMSVPIDIKVNDEEIVNRSEMVLLRMARKKLLKYLDLCADGILKTVKLEEESAKERGAKKPAGHAVFVSRQSEATDLCNILNKRLGYEGFIAYVSGDKKLGIDGIPPKEREAIQQKLNSGECIGFVTVMLGVESINIPRLKYCHCIARIKSENKLLQALGRVMRLPSETDADCCLVKREAVFIDYQVMRTRVMRLCCGIRTIAQRGGSNRPKIGKDGNIFANRDGFDITSLGMENYEAWIRKESGVEDRDAEMKKLALIAMAKAGLPRPSYKCKGK